ncbi:MAG: hypothetical protein GDA52_03280 [Rhodobacteraceae bacterium]|nr:hypothetical protein [Paracoccaceae bacterium]
MGIARAGANDAPPADLDTPTESSAESWRGITIAPESRCSAYDQNDYSYSAASIENRIVEAMDGRIFGPYSMTTFPDIKQTHISRLIAPSEAHDSGLCAADSATRRAFARDLDNLTLAAPITRNRKQAYDAAEWLPDNNRCWFANRVVEVRRKYDLTIDHAEAAALEAVLAGCTSTEMTFGDQ